MAMLQQVVAEAERTKHQEYLSDMYGRIIRRAQQVPQQVLLAPDPGMAVTDARAGVFWPRLRQIDYDPTVGQANMPNVVSHELTHFLNSLLPRPYGEDVQHQAIKWLLGTDVYKPASELQGYVPTGSVDPTFARMGREWLGQQSQPPGLPSLLPERP